MASAPAERKRSSPRGEARKNGVWWVQALHPKKRGAMEDQLIALARRLRAHGVPLDCVFAGPPVRFLDGALAELGVAVRRLDFEHELTGALTLGGWLLQARPRLVHFHFVPARSPLLAAARLSGARVLLSDHLTPGTPAPGVLQRWGGRFGLWDRRVAVSRHVAERVIDLEHADPARVEIIENGVNLERFAAAVAEGLGAGCKRELESAGRPLIVCVGGLCADKGVESAVRMLPQLGRQAVLALVGDGPLRSRVAQLAGELGVRERVRLVGLRDDVERLIAASDVVIVPSHHEEAFGLAVVEGMAAGKPVVVSRSGAMPEIVGDAGIVVPRRDPGALAVAVARLLDDPLAAARLGRRARARVQARYGLSRWLERVTALYARFEPRLRAPGDSVGEGVGRVA